MIQKSYLTIFVVALTFAAFFYPGVIHAGFGVTPPDVVADRLVPGATITKTIYLVQGFPEDDLEILATIESRDIKEWISIDQGMNFTIPAGVQQFPLKITVAVPKDAEFGEYKGSVRVKTTPKPSDVQEGGSGVAIALGGLINIEATVGDDVFVEFKVTGLDILDIKERESLQARIRINNTGNVSATADSASFELFDKFGNIQLAFARAEADQFPKVPAFTEESVTLEFPVDIVLAVGEYWGHVKIYDEKGGVVRELRTVFNVSERSFLDIITSPGAIIGALSVLVLLLLLVIFRRRIFKRGNKEEQQVESGAEQDE